MLPLLPPPPPWTADLCCVHQVKSLRDTITGLQAGGQHSADVALVQAKQRLAQMEATLKARDKEVGGSSGL